MNGQWLGSRAIRTNWSTRKPPTTSNKSGSKAADYEEIYNKTSPTNTTVYCGGFPPNVLVDDMIYKHFGQFGQIQDIRVFKDKGYAFVKFTSKETAARAIESTNNSDVYGHPVKCFWGKENGNGVDPSSVMMQGQGIMAAPPSANPTQLQQQQQIYAYQQQQCFYYPGYPQYMQGYMQAPFAYANPQQQSGYRMMPPTAVPANMANMAAWGVPPPPASGTAIQNSISNGSGSNTTPQPTMLYMQQFQTQ